jgi:hypothetical protein
MFLQPNTYVTLSARAHWCSQPMAWGMSGITGAGQSTEPMIAKRGSTSRFGFHAAESSHLVRPCTYE